MSTLGPNLTLVLPTSGNLNLSLVGLSSPVRANLTQPNLTELQLNLSLSRPDLSPHAISPKPNPSYIDLTSPLSEVRLGWVRSGRVRSQRRPQVQPNLT